MERLYIKPSLCKAIAEYCEANNINDINAFANRCTMQGFNIAKYGLSPGDNIERENKGIKDFKNESRRKRKEQSGVSDKNEQGTKKEDPSPKEEGKQEEGHPIRPVGGNRKEESKPTEETKKGVTVRKIRVIKKSKND